MFGITTAGVLALSFAARALSRHLHDRAKAKEAKERFTEDTCQMLSLPRVLAWNRGRAILADLDEDGIRFWCIAIWFGAFHPPWWIQALKLGTSPNAKHSSSWPSNVLTRRNDLKP